MAKWRTPPPKKKKKQSVFWWQIRFESTPEKKRRLFYLLMANIWPKLWEKRGFWRFWKSKISQISAKIGRKTTFVEKKFSQFLIINLAHILRKFEVYSPKSGGAISRSVFWCTDRNCILFGTPCGEFEVYQNDTYRFLVPFEGVWRLRTEFGTQKYFAPKRQK